MPNQQTMEKVEKDKREGRAPSTQAGEFVREEMHHVRQGKHGARSTKQAIAIGLSKARRAGVALPPPKKGRVSDKTQQQAERDYGRGQSGKARTSARRSQSRLRALKREGQSAASRTALSRQARAAAERRSQPERSAAAGKAARTRRREHV